MSEKPRIKTLSTRFLLPFKIFCFVAYSAFMLYITYHIIEDWTSVFMYASYAYIFYFIYRTLFRLKYVEHDDEYLYVRQNRVEVMIPLENIKSLEIKSLGGVYRVDLYEKDIVGQYFYFKPSLLYPLNHKSKDRDVEILGRKIEAAKRRRHEVPRNALNS